MQQGQGITIFLPGLYLKWVLQSSLHSRGNYGLLLPPPKLGKLVWGWLAYPPKFNWQWPLLELLGRELLALVCSAKLNGPVLQLNITWHHLMCLSLHQEQLKPSTTVEASKIFEVWAFGSQGSSSSGTFLRYLRMGALTLESSYPENLARL